MGWRNPTEAALGRIGVADLTGLDLVSNLDHIGAAFTLWSQPALGLSEIVATSVFPRDITGVSELRIGAPDTTETSAEGYHVWARVVTTEGTEGWLQLAVPSTYEVGSDNRPSSVDRLLLFTPGEG
jgi:hypothetical protein